MADISIQFYASPDELERFLSGWIEEYGIHATAMRYRPFSIEKLQAEEVGEAVREKDVRRFYLTQREPDLSGNAKSEFEESNASSLVLDIGKLDSCGLGESWLMCRTDDKDALKTWRQIAKSLREATQEGITATNRSNGVSEYYPGYRFTEGASKLESEGKAMLPVQGANGPAISLGDTTASMS